MRYQVAFIAAMLQSLVLFGQAPQCGTDDIMLRNPFLMERYNSRTSCDAPEVNLDTAQVLTIPVVVHVIHLGEPVGDGTNISDEQVLSCIENLNHRFRGDVDALAALTDQYDEYELSLVNDSKIEFCLASRDPDNLPTTGITRHDGSDLSYTNNFSGQTSTAYYAEDGVTNGSQFAIPLQGIPDSILKDWFSWPVDKYFNFYVVSEINGNNGGGGIQGYSYVGSLGTGLNGDSYGPVCLYNVTGTVGNLKVGRELNSTWTHEVGHAINLYHTFGVSPVQTQDCDSETNPCTQGDQVPDTPPTTVNQSCNPTCPDALVENYMDYSSETCKTNFTQNQIERMRHEIYTGLPYLLNTLSCQSPVGQDLAITNVTLPESWCRPTVDFSVTIANQGGGPILPGALLDINGEYYDIPIIAGGEYYTFNFTDFELPESGNVYTYIIYDADEYPVNDGVLTTVEIAEENWAEITITTDFFANEIQWFIGGTNNPFFFGQQNYPTGQETYKYGTCLTDGCYAVSISDSNGDGLCSFDLDDDGICDYGGSFNLNVGGVDIVNITEENADFGSNYTHNFCTYYCPPVECATDFDGDGVTGIQDLLMFLTTPMGNITECSPIDFNNDLQIDINDLMNLLNAFGSPCFGNTTFGTIEQDVTEVTPVVIEPTKCIVGDPMYFDLTGRQVMVGDLSQGIYIIVENWDDGSVTTRKVFIGGF